MKNFNAKLEEYSTLKAKIDEMQKQLNELKAEFITDLKERDITETDKGLLMSHQGKNFVATLLISNTETIDTQAVKKAFPGQYLKHGTRETFTIKAC